MKKWAIILLLISATLIGCKTTKIETSSDLIEDYTEDVTEVAVRVEEAIESTDVAIEINEEIKEATEDIKETVTLVEDEELQTILIDKIEKQESLIEIQKVELESTKKTLAKAEESVNELREELRTTSDRLTANCTELIQARDELQAKNKWLRKLILILSGIIILFVGVRVVIIYLKTKGIELPYLLNTLL